MRQVFKKQNSPRMQSAINRVLTSVYSVLTFSYYRRCRIVFYPYSSRNIGVSILILAYGADKYDVLNKLITGERNKIVTFARGDIRHKHDRMKILLLMFLAIIVLLAFINYCEPNTMSLTYRIY